MKTTFLIAIFSLTTMLTFSQTSEHLSFKGVPIDGTLEEYVSKMKVSGFTHIQTEDGIALLKGDFAGYKDCIVGVGALKQKNLVSKIIVGFPNQETWSALSGNYFNLKEMLTEKYGTPLTVVEKFHGTSTYERDDNSKMHEVKMDRCKYHSIWKTEKGDIELSIEHNGFTSCYVRLVYYDKINGEIMKAKSIDDL